MTTPTSEVANQSTDLVDYNLFTSNPALVEALAREGSTSDHDRIVPGRVDADAGVARSQQQPVQDRRGDAPGIVEGMIGLQPHAHSTAQTNSVTKSSHDFAFLGRQDQILVAHQFRNRRGHFRGNPARDACENVSTGCCGEQPVAERSDGE